ncbi:hypothetical protein ME9_01411 [Bartonella taylorii 8TBB]|uniref:Uncharacterized protein n=1 Tax=Bartonella taylorii 8TBB TaxID=1094560 RepID=A0A9P2RYV1_BARTA|nr:hypothetical protein ME9_01411 [Bartonella taylorii 8TBB]
MTAENSQQMFQKTEKRLPLDARKENVKAISSKPIRI